MRKISIGMGTLVIVLVISAVVSLVLLSGVSQASMEISGTLAYLPLIFKPENSPTPTITNTPHPPTATNTPHPPAPTATPLSPPGNCTICSYNAYNCPDFNTQAQAQACFDYCWSIIGYDVHRLDADEDGVACEALPIIWVIPEPPGE